MFTCFRSKIRLSDPKGVSVDVSSRWNTHNLFPKKLTFGWIPPESCHQKLTFGSIPPESCHHTPSQLPPQINTMAFATIGISSPMSLRNKSPTKKASPKKKSSRDKTYRPSAPSSSDSSVSYLSDASSKSETLWHESDEDEESDSNTLCSSSKVRKSTKNKHCSTKSSRHKRSKKKKNRSKNKSGSKRRKLHRHQSKNQFSNEETIKPMAPVQEPNDQCALNYAEF